MQESLKKMQEIKREIAKVIAGKEDVIEKVLMTILAGGHVLLEDVPGVGKTTLALAFSKTMELNCQRVQFTPDVLPSDIVGFSVLNKEDEFEYKAGAVMCNVFLADEINRTSAKTQAALLEVMEEGTVSVDGSTMQVPQPFFVMATQNPITSIGTQLLPESQLDRFMVKLSLGYPTMEQEIHLLKARHMSNPLDEVSVLLSREELIGLKEQVAEVFVKDSIYEYMVRLVDATRHHKQIQLGISPRGTLALVAMAKANAFLCGREYVMPEDVQNVFVDVTAHRIVLRQKAKLGGLEEAQVLEEILENVEKPAVKREVRA